MCGIAAILKSNDISCSTDVLDRMSDEVSYRGPDDKGLTFFGRFGSTYERVDKMEVTSDWEIGLGHRRLSILDLSHGGHQPMGYRNDYWIVFNGEIYNFIELRQELNALGHVFQTSSDTEVILAAYAEWGPACFRYLRGMWGIVLFDRMGQEVIVCRDRLGIKPLYLWEGPGTIALASEIKQFLHVPGFEARMHHESASLYLQTGHEDQSRTFFRDVWPVPPGHWFRISLDSLKCSAPEPYWHPEQIAVTITNIDEAAREFEAKFRESVQIHLRSDVPVGCALSGGLDSTSIAVLVNSLKGPQNEFIHTFTSTFPGHLSDERSYVDATIREIRALSHFITPDPLEFLNEFDRFTWIHDEPVGGCSMYAAYCIARLTHQAGVPVTLNGQGGDEIFSGYWQTYFLYLNDLLKKRKFIDLSGHFLGALLGKGNPDLLRQVPLMLRRYRARSQRFLRPRLRNIDGGSRGMIQNIMTMDSRVRRVHEIRSMFLPRLLKWDDRNFMAFSVEGRYPFLDHQLIELCLSFDPQVLYRRGWTKYPLRVGLGKFLPFEISNRRSKNGFETPQNDWLLGPFRVPIANLLEKDRPIWEYVDREDARALGKEVWQQNGAQSELGEALFRIFVFDRWLDVFGIKS